MSGFLFFKYCCVISECATPSAMPLSMKLVDLGGVEPPCCMHVSDSTTSLSIDPNSRFPCISV